MYLKIVMMVFCISGLLIRYALRGVVLKEKTESFFRDAKVSLFNDIKYDIMNRLLLKTILSQGLLLRSIIKNSHLCFIKGKCIGLESRL